MSPWPNSKNYYFYLQNTSVNIDKNKVLEIVGKFYGKVPKSNFNKNNFWLCLDMPFKVSVGEVIDTIKNELNIKEDSFVQTVSDFEHIDEVIRSIIAKNTNN